MKYLLIAALWIGFAFSSIAQTYFNKVYDFGGADRTGVFAPGVIGKDYYVSPTLTDRSFALMVHELDGQGNAQLIDSLDIPGVQILTGIPSAFSFDSARNQVVICGSYVNVLDSSNQLIQGFVAFLASTGEIKSYQTFDAYNFNALEGVSVSDSTYDFIGTVRNEATRPGFYFLKTDFEGNRLFETIIHPDTNFALRGHIIIPVDSGDFIIGGGKLRLGKEQHYLMRINSLGNIKWEQTYSNSRGAGDAIMLSDGNILYSGYGEDINENTYSVFRKINPMNGNKLWERELREFDMTFRNAQELPSGNILLGGWGYDTSGHNLPAIVKITPNGDLIWLKTYWYQDIYKPYFVLDFVQVGENELMLTGQINLPGKDQDVWIMKVDTNGCFNPDCLPLGTGFPEVKTVEFARVYPNPASTHFTIQSNTAAAVEYTLHTLSGKVVSSGQFVGQAEVSVADLAKGVYFIQLQHEAGIEVKKVILR